MERGPQVVLDDLIIDTFKAHSTCGVLHCEATGDVGGRVVMLLHNHYPGASCRDWRAYMPRLVNAGFRVWTFNFPGFGDASNRSDGDLLPARPDCALMPGGAVSCVLDILALIYDARPGDDPPEVALVGEGFGAAVALALAQWEPSLVSAIVLSHLRIQPGRFPFDGPELSSIIPPTAVLWAEMGPGTGRESPTLEACRGLHKAIPKSELLTVAKTPLVPPKLRDQLPEDMKPEIFLQLGGWPSERVFVAARGNKKYIAQAQALIVAEDAGDKASNRAEANEFRKRARAIKNEIDKSVHQDRGRAQLSGMIVDFFIKSASHESSHSLKSTSNKEAQQAPRQLESLPKLDLAPTPDAEPTPALLRNSTSARAPDSTTQSAMVHPRPLSRRPRNSPFYRHGMGLYGGGAASEVDALGHSATGDEPLPLHVGARVRASKSRSNQRGGQAAVKARNLKVESSAVQAYKKRLPYQWRIPEPLEEQFARRDVELGELPLLDADLTTATVVGVGVGGKLHTYALKYDDGDVEAHVHRLRIVGARDPFADSKLTARPPCAFDVKKVSTRLCPDGNRREIFVRTVGHATASPILLLHGSGPTAWSRDMQCLFEPLAAIGYRVICPDLPGYGDSLGKRWPSANESKHGGAGGPIQMLEDVLQAFNWRPSSGKVDDRPGTSHANNALDIVGYSTGAALALSFCLKHNQATRRSRVGALVLVNGVYSSGLDDAAIIAAAAASGSLVEPRTAKNDLARVRSKTFVLSVTPDLEHPKSFSSALAKNIPGAIFDEVTLPTPPREETLPLERAALSTAPGVSNDSSALTSPSQSSDTLPKVAPLSSSNLALLSKRAPRSSSVIPALQNAAQHCFEAHSGLFTPRIANFLLQHGHSAERGDFDRSGHATDGAADYVRLLSPTRKGLMAHQGPLLS